MRDSYRLACLDLEIRMFQMESGRILISLRYRQELSLAEWPGIERDVSRRARFGESVGGVDGRITSEIRQSKMPLNHASIPSTACAPSPSALRRSAIRGCSSGRRSRSRTGRFSRSRSRRSPTAPTSAAST